MMYGRFARETVREAALFKERWRFAEVDAPPAVRHIAPDGLEDLGDLHRPPDVHPLAAEHRPPGLPAPLPKHGCFACTHVRPSQPAGAGRLTQYGQQLQQSSHSSVVDSHYSARLAADQHAALHSRLRHRRRRQRNSEVEVPSAIPPLAPAFAKKSAWRTAVEGVWKYPSEHIKVKEMRVCFMAVRRATRRVRCVGRRALFLTDNMVAACSLEKGRARAWGLNSLCRRVAACAVATSLRPSWRY